MDAPKDLGVAAITTHIKDGKVTQEYRRVESWAMKGEDGKLYYACESFFGIQLMDDCRNGITEGTVFCGTQIISGECDLDCWWEIAQQLYAMKEGWA
jgi:hypothetical protein